MQPRLRIILVRPRNPDNIGAAARAMANFGLSDLALVAPFESDWREAAAAWRREASVSAIDAMDVVDAARLYGTIPEAAADCSLLLGTSSLHRLNPGRDVMLLSETPGCLSGRTGKTGILFGSEKTGLTKEELSFCSAIINIPTREKQPSMNLGQSVAVLAYELAARGTAAKPRAAREAIEPNHRELERAARRISAKLSLEAGPRWGGEAELRAIRQGLLDARLTKAAMNALNLLLDGKGGKKQ
ncbi:MAG: RNA methyltransferase [Elusimicrobia bacterium]|nr:RNA methyltransferase [Elusimicrobiota bacterium]